MFIREVKAGSTAKSVGKAKTINFLVVVPSCVLIFA